MDTFMPPLSILALRSMPNRADGDAFRSNAVENYVGSPRNDQLSHASLGTDASQAGLRSERFDDNHDTRSQTTRSLRFVERHKGMNFPQTRSCERRPNNLNRRFGARQTLCALRRF